MREIKFRYFDHKNKQMVVQSWSDRIDKVVRQLEENVKVSPLMQYTGLKDKNGVEIYEGDIIRKVYYSKMWNKKMEITQSVNWNFEESGFDLSGKYFESIEVIGNIYENPELIEVSE